MSSPSISTYQLARERGAIAVGEIARTWISTISPRRTEGQFPLMSAIVEPALEKAEEAFMAGLDAITVEDLYAQAVAAGVFENDAFLPLPEKTKT